MRALLVFAIARVAIASSSTFAQPTPNATRTDKLAALAPSSTDDARGAVAIGPQGEVYEPDGKAAWARKQRISTADAIVHVGRAGGAVIALAAGHVYRLAPNGWSAIRLHQKERALMSEGTGVVAAVGRQVFALDRTAAGEPVKLVTAPSTVIAIGSGATSAVVQTDKGLFRVEGTKLVAVKHAPPGARKLVSDRWVLVSDGAIDLRSGRKTGWPPGVAILAVATTADGLGLVLVVGQNQKLELVTLVKDKLEREPIEGAPAGAVPVGVAVDAAKRAVIALRDGAILVRDAGVWTITRVTDDLPPGKPGAPPAVSP